MAFVFVKNKVDKPAIMRGKPGVFSHDIVYLSK